jgi:hypothetical protein
VSFLNRMALLSAAAIVVASVGLGALPANAATARPNTVSNTVVSHKPNTAPLPSNAIGAVLCSGDLCIQTVGCLDGNSKVSIDEWANSGFFGHFELELPNGTHQNSLPSGNYNYDTGSGYVFTADLVLQQPYEGIAWSYNAETKAYSDVGHVTFTVNTCS